MKIKTMGEIVGYSRIDSAKASGTGLSTIDNAIRGGELKAHKLGRRTIILRDDLFAWLRSLPLASVDSDKATA
jgi:excisionase family DNA binding protein